MLDYIDTNINTNIAVAAFGIGICVPSSGAMPTRVVNENGMTGTI